MTAEQMTLDLWEMKPRCLVIVPDLSFQEFAESVWASVRGVHESINWYIGDALIYAETNFGAQASQLLDEQLTPARMAQLKWVAEAIPPSRRRDDCSWTAHREVAGLFNRRRGIFPAMYLDRKAEHQDRLLALAGEGKWHSDRMAAEVKALEEEALNSITRRNEPPEDEQRDPEPAEAAEAIERSEAVDGTDQREVVETNAGQADGCGSIAHLCPVDEAVARQGAGSDNPVPHGEKGGSPAEASEGETALAAFMGQLAEERAAPDRAELRACIDMLRSVSPTCPIADPQRVAVALGKPGIDLNSTDHILSAFSPGWRRKMEDQVDDQSRVRWSVMATKAGAQRAMAINPILSYALAEAALAAMLSDMGPEAMPAREPVIAAITLPPKTTVKPILEPLELLEPPTYPTTPLMLAYLALDEKARSKMRKWVLLGFALPQPEPAPVVGTVFEAAYRAATEDERKPFRAAILNEAEAA